VVVTDASIAVCLLANRPLESVDLVRGRLAGEELHAPHLIDIETAHALRRFVFQHLITEIQAYDAITWLAELPLIRHPHTTLLQAIWRMRDNRTAYDAVYVALADALDAPLITLDSRLARTPSRVPIEVL
jgi:predicted nucleic acid-binding protein